MKYKAYYPFAPCIRGQEIKQVIWFNHVCVVTGLLTKQTTSVSATKKVLIN